MGKVYSDNVIIDYKAYNADLSNLQSLSVNVGSNAQYLDPAGNVWIEDKPYQNGSFGFVSGTGKVFDRKDVIMNTDDEPMFYTYRDSVQAYRFDVPAGKYRLTLGFAEPNRLNKGDRVFDVRINNEIVLKDLDLTGMYGFAQAAFKIFIIDVKDSGLQVSVRFKKRQSCS